MYAYHHGNPSYLVWDSEFEIKELKLHTKGRGKDPEEERFKQMTAQSNTRRSFLSSVYDGG